MKAIMYHYVRPYSSELPNLRNLHIDDFKKQLDYFGKEYGFVSREDFETAVRTGEPTPGVVLTFDDGLVCHYDFVYRELKKRGGWGIFYVSTQPYVRHTMIDVHRVHFLLGKYGARRIYGLLEGLVDESMFDQQKLAEFKQFTYRNQKNDHYELLVKKTLNYYLNYNYRTDVISRLMNQLVDDEARLAKEYYVTLEQLREMHEGGMVIGSHTENHFVMSRLDAAQQKREIQQSFRFIEDTLGQLPHKTYCHPHGGFHSFNRDTERILEEEGCLYSFNVEQRDILSSDLTGRPQALPRYDCNQFEYGQVRSVPT